MLNSIKINTNDQLKDKLDAFQVRCCEARLKVTPQRVAVYKVLIQTDEHPSTEMVFQTVKRQFPNISLDTVNRTLLTLNEIGAAFIVEGSGDAKRFDGNLGQHQHFKCLKCKSIVDLYIDPISEINVPASLKNCTILKKTVYFEGICDSCRGKR